MPCYVIRGQSLTKLPTPAIIIDLENFNRFKFQGQIVFYAVHMKLKRDQNNYTWKLIHRTF